MFLEDCSWRRMVPTPASAAPGAPRADPPAQVQLAPWILGSGGTLVFDFTILCQVAAFGDGVDPDEDAEGLSKPLLREAGDL